MNITETITGKGLVFPIQIEDGTVKPKGGEELIRSCIRNILVFELGDRYFQRNFGVGLETFLSEPNDIVTEALLDHRLKTQLPLWDKRITVTDLTTFRSGNDSTLHVRVTISLTGVDQTEAIIFPINSTL